MPQMKRWRKEQTSLCPPLMTDNRLNGITIKIWEICCSTFDWDIAVIFTTIPKWKLWKDLKLSDGTVGL